MITLIHGDNELQIRKELQSLKDKAKGEMVILQKPDPLTLRQHIGSSNMFFVDRFFVVEQMFEKGVSVDVITFLADLPQETTIVFAERKRIDRAEGKSESKTILKGKKLLDALKKAIPSSKVIACNDYTIFDFMDALRPKNTKQVMQLYDKLLDMRYAPEEIYYQLQDHIRNLIIANDLGKSGLKGMHEFRAGKIVQQARQFELKQLIKIYQKLFQLEVAQKLKRISEGSPFSMEEDLRFFLATAI